MDASTLDPLVLDLKRAEISDSPFRHAYFPRLLCVEHQQRVRSELLSAQGWQRNEVPLYRYHGLNIASGPVRNGASLAVLLDLLSSRVLCEAFEKILRAPHCQLSSLFAHRMVDGDDVRPHVDADHEADRYRFLIYPGCPDDFSGGELMLYAQERGQLFVKRVLSCRDGQGFLFGFGRDCFHSVRPVRALPDTGRLCLVATYSEAPR
jgi:hypothetical protein